MWLLGSGLGRIINDQEWNTLSWVSFASEERSVPFGDLISMIDLIS